MTMKKYRLFNNTTHLAIADFDSAQEVADKIAYIIWKAQDTNLKLLDFSIEEIEEREPNEVIRNYKAAKKYLSDRYGIMGTYMAVWVPGRALKATEAFIQLLIIAEAWNKIDGFTPDFDDTSQGKWKPNFENCKGKMKVSGASNNIIISNGCVPFHFKTKERAKQFGEQFIDLWRTYLLNK